ncbi:MAG: MerR family transcriptional regulator [Pseudomonadota bacterium]|nr:MerR family transcriptional regulator [Pseudomonadota bacterium]
MAKTIDARTMPTPSGKSATAFRTISEVAEELTLPPHVLRFWETKFVQVKPLKRGGGRRYYRREDIELLRRIRDFLYTDGYTIKGVQKLLRRGGMKEDFQGAQTSMDASGAVRTEDNSVSITTETSAALANKEKLEAVLIELEEVSILLNKTLS